MILDLYALPDQELAAHITKRCAEFGSVRNVQIRRVDGGASLQFAIVRMSTHQEAEELFKQWGVARSGDSAIIRLTQRLP